MSGNFLGSDIKKLGFGMMRLPMKGKEIDLEQTKDMVDKFMEKGFTYFDTAYPYLDGHSEPTVEKVLTSRYPRESYQLATKLPAWCMEKKEDAERIFEEQLERTQAGYFDFYLLHAMDRERAGQYEEFGAWEYIEEQKKAGRIKHIGFSFHDTADCLDEILTRHPETEFVQLQINYIDWEDSIIQAGKCYEVARKHHKPVIIMEPVKGGTLAQMSPEVTEILKEANPELSAASWALRYAASLDGVITVLSGMSDMEQMEDNLSFMEDLQTLSSQERKVIDKVTAKLKSIPSIPCTNCQYCMEKCPQQIPIPKIFQEYNTNTIFHKLEESKNSYKFIVSGAKKASECLECGMCEEQCPQHIKIVEKLKEATELFE